MFDSVMGFLGKYNTHSRWRTILPVVAGIIIAGSATTLSDSVSNKPPRQEPSRPARVEMMGGFFSQEAQVKDVLAKYGDKEILCVEKKELLFTCGGVPPKISVRTLCYFVDDIPRLPQNTQGYLGYARSNPNIIYLQANVSEMFNESDTVQTIGPLF